MNPFLFLLRFGTPGFVKKRGLAELFAVAAEAFGAEPPNLRGVNYGKSLELFARFTHDRVQSLRLRGQDDSTVRKSLYSGAYRIGVRARRLLGISDISDAMECAALLYRFIGIDFKGSPRGEIVISRCYFSNFYSPETCRLISALDEGVLAGVSGNGRLVFERRITDGDCCCRARLIQEKN